MELVSFVPQNELEVTIANTRMGACSMDELLTMLRESNLYVSSRTEVLNDGSGFSPLLLGDTAHPLVAVFSSLSRPELHKHMAEYILQINGKELFKRIPPGYGIVLNPGYKTQLIISSDALGTT